MDSMNSNPTEAQPQEHITSALLTFQTNQKRLSLIIKCDGKQDTIKGKVLVAGKTKSKIFQDNLPGNRTAAIFISHLDIVQVSPVPEHGSPLFEAVKENNFDKVSNILRLTMNESINESDEHFGWSSLHWASFNGNILIVLELLAHPQININIFANVRTVCLAF
jgi:ankyrin repeat protein